MADGHRGTTSVSSPPRASFILTVNLDSDSSIEVPREIAIRWRRLSQISLTEDFPDNESVCIICHLDFEIGRIC